jgi:hypothetical protein
MLAPAAFLSLLLTATVPLSESLSRNRREDSNRPASKSCSKHQQHSNTRLKHKQRSTGTRHQQATTASSSMQQSTSEQQQAVKNMQQQQQGRGSSSKCSKQQ